MKDNDFIEELHKFLYNEGFTLKSTHDENYSIITSGDWWDVIDWQGTKLGNYKTLSNAIKKIHKLIKEI
jgi:hypothetical protein